MHILYFVRVACSFLLTIYPTVTTSVNFTGSEIININRLVCVEEVKCSLGVTLVFFSGSIGFSAGFKVYFVFF